MGHIVSQSLYRTPFTGTELPNKCWCAVKKLLTHSLTLYRIFDLSGLKLTEEFPSPDPFQKSGSRPAEYQLRYITFHLPESCDHIAVSGVASYGALVHVPSSTYNSFIFSSLWSESHSQLSEYCVVCEISWCRCQQLTALSISTALDTKVSHRAAATPGPEVRRECTMTYFPALLLLATNPGDATGCNAFTLRYKPRSVISIVTLLQTDAATAAGDTGIQLDGQKYYHIIRSFFSLKLAEVDLLCLLKINLI